MSMHDARITEAQFFDDYRPIERADGSLVLDWDDVRTADPNKVWTLVDGDDGGIYALAGVHVVNRLGYVLTERAWPDVAAEAEYWPPEDDEDDDDEGDQP